MQIHKMSLWKQHVSRARKLQNVDYGKPLQDFMQNEHGMFSKLLASVANSHDNSEFVKEVQHLMTQLAIFYIGMEDRDNSCAAECREIIEAIDPGVFVLYDECVISVW